MGSLIKKPGLDHPPPRGEAKRAGGAPPNEVAPSALSLRPRRCVSRPDDGRRPPATPVWAPPASAVEVLTVRFPYPVLRPVNQHLLREPGTGVIENLLPGRARTEHASGVLVTGSVRSVKISAAPM